MSRERTYSADELSALRRALDQDPMGGPARYATGPYWPYELERRAREYERLIPSLYLAAAALRREIRVSEAATESED